MRRLHDTRTRRATLIALIGCAAIPIARVGFAATGATTEQVYAVFTLNLTRFSTWSESAFPARDAPFVNGTFERDPINAPLEVAVRGEAVNGHPIRTMRLGKPADVQRCQLIFVSRELGRARDIMPRLVRRPVLTVSGEDDFPALGGHVRFVSQPPHVRLGISAENLKRSGLEAQAQLLQLASPAASTP